MCCIFVAFVVLVIAYFLFITTEDPSALVLSAASIIPVYLLLILAGIVGDISSRFICRYSFDCCYVIQNTHLLLSCCSRPLGSRSRPLAVVQLTNSQARKKHMITVEKCRRSFLPQIGLGYRPLQRNEWTTRGVPKCALDLVFDWIGPYENMILENSKVINLKEWYTLSWCDTWCFHSPCRKCFTSKKIQEVFEPLAEDEESLVVDLVTKE